MKDNTPMTPEALTALADKMRTQDNACTAHPLFVVYNEKKLYGMDDEFAEDYDWIDQTSGDYTVADDRKRKALERYENYFGREPESWAKRYYIKRDEFVTCAFTLDAANDFIKRKHYDYARLHVYVESMWRMPEMIAIEEHLLSHATPRTQTT
jgi:hypothetical protein